LNPVVEATWAEGRDHDHDTGQGHGPVDGPDLGPTHGHANVPRPDDDQSQGQETGPGGRGEEAAVVVATTAAVGSIVVDRNPATGRRNILHVFVMSDQVSAVNCCWLLSVAFYCCTILVMIKIVKVYKTSKKMTMQYARLVHFQSDYSTSASCHTHTHTYANK